MNKCLWCGDELKYNFYQHPIIKYWKFCNIEHYNLFENNIKYDRIIEDWLYYAGQSVKCWHCKWTGILRETKQGYVYSSPRDWQALAGREGYEYKCPKCGFIVKSNYTKMS